ncbi:MAG: hypothetical protein IPH13_22675 [Planctomycetes bacterium]|nr:hypothetical protein [Planctomycetota bacterium]
MTDRVALLIRELEFRRDRVLEWRVPQHDPADRGEQRFHRLVAEFVHFALVTPEFRHKYLSLFRYVASVESAAGTKALKNRVEKCLRKLAKRLIESPEWIRFASTALVNGERVAAELEHDFRSVPPHYLPRDELVGVIVSGKIHAFPEPAQVDRALWIADVIERAMQSMRKASESNRAKWHEGWFNELHAIRGKLAELEAHYGFEMEYEGAGAAALLESGYQVQHPHGGASRPWGDIERLAIRSMHEVGMVRGGMMATPTEIQEACRFLTLVLAHAALRRRSRHDVVDRFAKFCAWYARRDLVDMIREAKRRKEARLHTFMNGFLFREGYLPMAEVHLGPHRPDTLALDLRRLAEAHQSQAQPLDDLLLIEVKQSLGRLISNADFTNWVGQAATYAAQVAHFIPALDRCVYLLVFVDGKLAYGAPEAIEFQGATVRPVLVDLGDIDTSKRKPQLLEFRPVSPSARVAARSRRRVK